MINSLSKIYGIYGIYCKTTNKYYIGQTKCLGGIKKRWEDHIRKLNQNTHHSSKLQAAWNKYTPNDFEIQVLFEIKDINISAEYLDTLEIDFIIKHNSFTNGYNLTSGGTGGKVISEETKTLIGSYHKGKVISDKQKQQVSKKLTGRKLSDETKQKMSESAQGKRHGPQSEEAKLRIALSNKTRPNRFPTPEHREKLKLAQALRKLKKQLKTE